MAVISVRVTEEGFHVSEEMARQLGLSPGEEARLEIRRALDAEAVRPLAMRFAWRQLGDAVGVDEPVWEEESWHVPLKVRGYTGTFGELYISAAGEILRERITSKAELLERVNAARARPPTTRVRPR